MPEGVQRAQQRGRDKHARHTGLRLSGGRQLLGGRCGAAQPLKMLHLLLSDLLLAKRRLFDGQLFVVDARQAQMAAAIHREGVQLQDHHDVDGRAAGQLAHERSRKELVAHVVVIQAEHLQVALVGNEVSEQIGHPLELIEVAHHQNQRRDQHQCGPHEPQPGTGAVRRKVMHDRAHEHEQQIHDRDQREGVQRGDQHEGEVHHEEEAVMPGSPEQ
mmetsp:Transcript_10938/g.33530  ORF Transcript_10938/g.33530 Transcript_10938/m.33530 type:complete len:216 (-) Transcript_10938:3109-3756(-)